MRVCLVFREPFKASGAREALHLGQGILSSKKELLGTIVVKAMLT